MKQYRWILLSVIITTLIFDCSLEIISDDSSTIIHNSFEQDITTIPNDITPITDSPAEDIEQLFEKYEQQYTKNTKWLTDDKNSKQISETELSNLLSRRQTSQQVSTANITSDDIVNVVENIVAESSRQLNDINENDNDNASTKDDQQRTVVVVVTTNVYHINNNGPLSAANDEQTAKQQHAWLSFGNPILLIRNKIHTLQSNDNDYSDILPADEEPHTFFNVPDSSNNTLSENDRIRDYILSHSTVNNIMHQESTKASS